MKNQYLKSKIILSTLILTTNIGHSAPPPLQDLKEINSIVCTGNDEILINNKSIIAQNNAIKISDNCDVKIVNSRITAKDTAIILNNNSSLHIENSVIESNNIAINANNNSDVQYTKSVIRGTIQANGNSDVDNLDGSTPINNKTAFTTSINVGNIIKIEKDSMRE